MRLFNNHLDGSARKQIAIEGVQDDLLLLPNNKYCSVIETSAINFELKSEAEQDALIDSYQTFLNGLDGPIQIIIRTREIDLDNYLSELETKALKEVAVYKQQLISYSKYLKSLVNVNRILTRNFYVVVPYLATAKQEYDLSKEQLSLRVDIVFKSLQKLGMHVRLLSGLEILNLFYVFYNPSQAKIEPLSDAALRLMHTAIVGEEKK